MNDNNNAHSKFMISYMQLRKVIGYLGMSLSLLLALGAYLIFDNPLERSLSAYYHTGMRDILVATLCVMGFFMYAYKGYDRRDDVVGDIACVFALCIAFFPTAIQKPGIAVSQIEETLSLIHGISTGVFFSALIYFCLILFTKSDSKNLSVKKKARNKIYRACGYIMGLCIILIGVVYILPESMAPTVEAYYPVFWLESLAIFAFSFSWLTKGQAILKDD